MARKKLVRSQQRNSLDCDRFHRLRFGISEVLNALLRLEVIFYPVAFALGVDPHVFTLTQAGDTYKELGVHHLPRQAGRATGANLSVILHAFRELFAYSYKWQREKQKRIQQTQVFHTP